MSISTPLLARTTEILLPPGLQLYWILSENRFEKERKENLHNVKPVLGKPDDPLLPSKVEAVLLLKTYHEVAQPITLLRNLRSSLAHEARVGVIDRNGNGENHGVAQEVVIREASEAGYRLLEQDDFVKDGMDYFLVFGAK
jgi:hypothetical protein